MRHLNITLDIATPRSLADLSLSLASFSRVDKDIFSSGNSEPSIPSSSSYKISNTSTSSKELRWQDRSIERMYLSVENEGHCDRNRG